MILSVLAVATAVLHVSRSDARDATCETTMSFDGVTYSVYEVTEEIVGKDEVGVGIEQGCGDDGRWSDDVTVHRIADVDPRLALVAPVAAQALYVAADGTIDELPSRIAELVSR